MKSQNQTQNEIHVPKVPLMGSKLQLVQHQGFWLTEDSIDIISNFQKNFHAHDTDLIIASHPKTGTTWLKSLLFAVVSRARNPHTNNQTQSQELLLTHNPHELVLNLESCIFRSPSIFTMNPSLKRIDELPSPRLFQTHFPYTWLPESIISSKCKLLYICRNPLDTIVSQWHFYPTMIRKIFGHQDFELPRFEDYFDYFFEGKIPYGPYLDHVVGYWEESLKNSDKVLFFKYEDLKQDASFQLKRLAEFVGMPFSPEEESEGVIQEIIQLCSIKNLKELEVNKSGKFFNTFENKLYFRKGEVGDWTNYFTPTMIERMDELMEEKLRGTDLSFKLIP